MPRQPTKRERALKHLEHARDEVDKALSLLGGRTRYKPKVVTREFIARQYLESLDARLNVTQALLLSSGYIPGQEHSLLGPGLEQQYNLGYKLSETDAESQRENVFSVIKHSSSEPPAR
jgi:hypothetical protein